MPTQWAARHPHAATGGSHAAPKISNLLTSIRPLSSTPTQIAYAASPCVATVTGAPGDGNSALTKR